MCDDRCSCARRIRWHVRHSSGCCFLVCTSVSGALKRESDDSFFVCGSCPVWQSTQARLRDSWGLPYQNMRFPFAWHERQALFFSSGVFLESFVNRRMVSLVPPASTCARPGPWHASQPSFSWSVRGCANACPITVFWKCLP